MKMSWCAPVQHLRVTRIRRVMKGRKFTIILVSTLLLLGVWYRLPGPSDNQAMLHDTSLKSEIVHGAGPSDNHAVKHDTSVKSKVVRGPGPVHDLHSAGTSSNNGTGPTVIIIFAYMKGGSSHLGQVVNRNDAVFYSSEPGWNIYNSYIVTERPQIPFQIPFHEDGTPRYMPPAERQYVMQQLRRLFHCNYRLMPAEITISTAFQLNPNHTRNSGQREFKRCLLDNNVKLDQAKLCQPKISKSLCPSWIGLQTNQSCRVFMERVRNDNSTAVPGFPSPGEYIACMQPLRTAAAKCVHVLERACRTKKFRAAKILRMQMDMVDDLLMTFPKIKVLFQLRDPRAIILSRSKTWLLAFKNLRNLTKEASFLCKKMVADITKYRLLSIWYPDVFMKFRYEDLSENPMKITDAIYEHTGIPRSELVDRWLQSEIEKSTRISQAWRSKIPPELKESIDTVCKELYEMTDYSP